MAKKGGRKKKVIYSAHPALNPPTRTEYREYVVTRDSEPMCATCQALDWNPDGNGNWAFCSLKGRFLKEMFGTDNPLGENCCDNWFQD